MRYFYKIVNIILGLFLVFSAMLLIFAHFEPYFVEGNKILFYIQYIGLIYVILLFVTVITLLIGSIIGAIYGIKQKGVKLFAKETILSFLGTMLLVIILSLLLDKKVLNTDKLFLPFVSLFLPSLVRFFAKEK